MKKIYFIFCLLLFNVRVFSQDTLTTNEKIKKASQYLIDKNIETSQLSFEYAKIIQVNTKIFFLIIPRKQRGSFLDAFISVTFNGNTINDVISFRIESTQINEFIISKKLFESDTSWKFVAQNGIHLEQKIFKKNIISEERIPYSGSVNYTPPVLFISSQNDTKGKIQTQIFLSVTYLFGYDYLRLPALAKEEEAYKYIDKYFNLTTFLHSESTNSHNQFVELHEIEFEKN